VMGGRAVPTYFFLHWPWGCCGFFGWQMASHHFNCHTLWWIFRHM